MPHPASSARRWGAGARRSGQPTPHRWRDPGRTERHRAAGRPDARRPRARAGNWQLAMGRVLCRPCPSQPMAALPDAGGRTRTAGNQLCVRVGPGINFASESGRESSLRPSRKPSVGPSHPGPPSADRAKRCARAPPRAGIRHLPGPGNGPVRRSSENGAGGPG
jgi:hypothetical protein